MSHANREVTPRNFAYVSPVSSTCRTYRSDVDMVRRKFWHVLAATYSDHAIMASNTRGVQKVRGPTMKEQRYELGTLD